jgi:hypothetical protein
MFKGLAGNFAILNHTVDVVILVMKAIKTEFMYDIQRDDSAD